MKRALRLSYLTAILLASALHCAAAYVRGDLVWKCDFTPEEATRYGVAECRPDEAGRGAEYQPRGGASGNGALRFRSPGQDYEIKISVKPDASLAGMLLVEADVKGMGIGDGVRPWNGAKVMMPFTPPGKGTEYPQTPNETGSFDWKTWSMVRDFGEPAGGPTLVLGLEYAAGEFEVDAVRIYRVREIPDDEVVPPAVNKAAARIPRGTFAGRHNPAARRGAMCGYRMEEADVATLASWGANLARLQIGGSEMIHAPSPEAWFAALSNRLDWCEAVMDRCARHGIKVVLDLHVGPACVVSKNAANLLPKDYLGHEYDPSDLVRAWRIIATRFRDHPATYGYDILNEPSVEPETWRRICREVIAAVRPIDPKTPFVVEIPGVTDKARYRLEEPNVIYSPHFYSPQELTHCGVGGANVIRWSYPGYINGVWWDKEQIRVALKPWIEFQRAHPDAPILVGEFSCILWSKGADQWIRDCIELFEEYGWSWCYHAYREWPAWDVEYTNDPDWAVGKWVKADADTARKRELLRGFSHNGHTAERAITKGSNPVFSPDGSRIAFQRLENDIFKVGIVAVPDRQGMRSGQADGGASPPGEPSIVWIENGPGNAAYPAWTPDGGLVYTAGNDAGTAHEAWKSGAQSGYGLRLWKDGVKRDLTQGRCRDYTPCVSPDGKQVWFVTTRGIESESASFSQAAASRIAVMDLAQSSQHIVLDSPNGNNSGYVQPAVSPDGSLLVWSHLDSFFDIWRICGMRLDGGTIAGETPTPPVAPSPCPVTPSSLVALSPRWHPDGRLICFTGFRKGDPGWGVWVEDIRSGKVKRLATGENPCFSPDGAFLAYDRDDTVYIRPFGPDDEPDENLPDIRDDEAPETTLWTAEDIVSETSIDISDDNRFAFGDGTAFFVRATVQLNGSDGVRQIVTGDYAEKPRAFQVYVSGGDIWLSTRGFDGKWIGVKAPWMRPPAASSSQTRPEAASPGILSIVAVRTPKRLVLSVDGGEPKTVLQGPFLSLETPQRFVAGVGLKQGEAIHSLELGTGWPKELPKGKTREDLFQ